VNYYTKTCLSINFTDLHLKWDIKIWTEGFNYLNIGFTYLFCILAFFYSIWIMIYFVDRIKAKKLEPKLKNYFYVCFFYFYSIHLFILPRSLFDFNLKCFFYIIYVENTDNYVLIYLVILFSFQILILVQSIKYTYKK